MPRLKRAVPSYRRRRGRKYQSGRREADQAVVTINGNDHYLGPYNSTASRAEYDRLIAEWLASGRHSVATANTTSSISVVEVLAAYVKYAKTYYRKNGEQTSEFGAIKSAVTPLKRLYGKTAAEDFGPLALKALRQQYIDAGQSRAVVNQNVGRIRRIFKCAAAQEMLPATVPQALFMVAGLRKGRTEAIDHEPVEPISDKLIEATLPKLPVVVADMVRLQRLTGMRPNEVWKLRPCDVNTEGDVWLYRPETHKTEHHGRDRVIPIGPKGQILLTPYLDRATDSYCFSRWKAKKDVEPYPRTPAALRVV